MPTTTNSGIGQEVKRNPLCSSKSIHPVKETSTMKKNAPALSAEMLAILGNSSTAELLALINAATTQVEPELAAMRAEVYTNACYPRVSLLAANGLLLAAKQIRNEAAAEVAAFVAANKVASGQPMRASEAQKALISEVVTTVPNPNNGERNVTVLATSAHADGIRQDAYAAFESIREALALDARSAVTADAEKPETDDDAPAEVAEADTTAEGIVA